MTEGLENNLTLLAPYLNDVETTTLREWLEHAFRRHQEQIAWLVRLADSVSLVQYWEKMESEHRDLSREEVGEVAALLREALAEARDDGLWAVLYLVCALRGLAAARVRQRLEPAAPPAAPSAFVYAMQ